MEYAFYLGVDVDGDAVLTLVEKQADDAADDASYHLRHLERVDLVEDEDETPVTDRVQALLAEAPYTGRSVVVVNRTTQNGQVLLDTLNERGLTPLGIHLAVGEDAAQEGGGMQLEGGDDAAEDESSFFVSELALVERLVELHRDGRFIAEQPGSDHASKLVQGLQRYSSYFDELEATEEAEAIGEAESADIPLSEVEEEAGAGGVGDEDEAASSSELTETEERDVEYDHITISAALSCWLGEEHAFDPTVHLSREIPDTGEVKRERRPDTAQ